jgi:hypothetical protein
MRNLKKNSVSALMATAVFSGILPITFGGYFEKGEKRDPNDLGAGEWAIGGKKMPKYAGHIPLLESMQVYQTVKNAHEAAKFKGQGQLSSMATGAAQGAVGLAEHIPFVGTTEKDLTAFMTPEGRQKYFTNLAISLVIPPDVGALARTLDNDTPRKPTTTGEAIKNVIPGMRKDVPLNERKVHQEIIGKMRKEEDLNEYQQEVYDNLGKNEKAAIDKEVSMTPMQSVFSKQPLEKAINIWKNLTDSQRDEVRDAYENKINHYLLDHEDVSGEALDKLNEKIDNAENRR